MVLSKEACIKASSFETSLLREDIDLKVHFYITAVQYSRTAHSIINEIN